MAEMFVLGAVLLLAIVFAEYAGMRKGVEKQMGWIAAGGWFFILGEALMTGWETLVGSANIGLLNLVFGGLGGLFVLIGVLWAGSKMLRT